VTECLEKFNLILLLCSLILVFNYLLAYIWGIAIFTKNFINDVIVLKKVIGILMDFDKLSKIIKSSVSGNVFCLINCGRY